VTSLREEVEQGRKKGLDDSRRFFGGADGMEQWGEGPCTRHTAEGEGGGGGLVRGTVPEPTEAGGSSRQRSQTGRRGRRLDKGGGGENGSPTCGPGGHSTRRFNRSSDSN
jgi:hypothetical protein